MSYKLLNIPCNIHILICTHTSLPTDMNDDHFVFITDSTSWILIILDRRNSLFLKELHSCLQYLFLHFLVSYFLTLILKKTQEEKASKRWWKYFTGMNSPSNSTQPWLSCWGFSLSYYYYWFYFWINNTTKILFNSISLFFLSEFQFHYSCFFKVECVNFSLFFLLTFSVSFSFICLFFLSFLLFCLFLIIYLQTDLFFIPFSFFFSIFKSTLIWANFLLRWFSFLLWSHFLLIFFQCNLLFSYQPIHLIFFHSMYFFI